MFVQYSGWRRPLAIQQDTLYRAVKFSGSVEDAKRSGLLSPAIANANTLIVRSRAGSELSCHSVGFLPILFNSSTSYWHVSAMTFVDYSN